MRGETSTSGSDLTAANDIQLNAGNTISVQSISTPSSNFSAQAETFNLNGNITATSVTLQLTSAFNGTAGSVVSAQNLSLTMATPFTFNTTDASTTRFDLTNLTALTINAPSITLNGNITATNVTLQLTSAFNGPVGSVVSAQNLSLTIGTPFTFNTTDASTTRFDLTNLTALTIKAPSIAFDTDITLSSPTGDLTATAGNIDASGHQLTGFDQISATGNFTVAGVTANQFHIGGTLTALRSLRSTMERLWRTRCTPTR